MAPQTLTFVTGNPHKLAEVQAILQPLGIAVQAQALELPEIQGSPHDIARHKAQAAFAALQTPLITEDTCLCFHALHDLPGPYIKWFLQALGHAGLNRLLAGFDDTSAHALCTFALHDGAQVLLFDGRTDGCIVPARCPPGKPVFGWDPVFQPDGAPHTFAEMDPAAKNAISHRSRALQRLVEHLRAAAVQQSQQA